MKLERIEIKNYRSISSGAADGSLVLDLGEGMNAITGPNNAGKSNVFRALALALDPDFEFNRMLDMPARASWAKPTVTLTFKVPKRGRSPREETLLKYVEAYERAVRPEGRTYAADGIVKLRVTIEGAEDSAGSRRQVFVVRGVGARSLPDDHELAKKAIAQFDSCFHFVMINSGQSLESLMEGKFRDILQNVLKEDHRKQFAQAEASREAYSKALQDELLTSFTSRISEEVRGLFPEIAEVSLVPEVGSLDDTLARMRVKVSDGAITDLADKGTGVRGGLIVAMLRHFADVGRRSLLFAVEEPESFLHPAAQESLRTDLEELTTRADVSLVVTTHSPHILSRSPRSRIFAIEKTQKGVTCLKGAIAGSDEHAPLIAPLYPDPLYARWLDRCHALADEAELLLVVEGYTDRRYIELGLAAAGRSELLDAIAIIEAGAGFGPGVGGAAMAVAQAITLRSTTKAAVAVLLDSDEPGQQAEAQFAKIREKTKDWQPKKTLFSYRFAFSQESKQFPYEAEDLWPDHLYEGFCGSTPYSERHHGTRPRPKPEAGHHWDLTDVGKEQFLAYLADHLEAADSAKWVALLEQIRSGTGLGKPKASSGEVEVRPGAASPPKAFLDAIQPYLVQAAEGTGLRVNAPHHKGAYTRVTLGSEAGPYSRHHLLFRATKSDCSVRLVVNRHGARQDNLDELLMLKEQLGERVEELPTAPSSWLSGEGEAVRALATSELPGGGYLTGDIEAVGTWVASMVRGWWSILTALAADEEIDQV